MVLRCSSGSVPSAPRTVRASSRRATSTSVRSGASKRSSTTSSVALQPVDGSVVDDPEDPGAHAPARLVVPQAIAPDRQERLLHDILRRGLAAGDPVGERVRRPAVAVIEQLERARILALHELHHLFVRQIADVMRHSEVPTRERPSRMCRLAPQALLDVVRHAADRLLERLKAAGLTLLLLL